MAVDHDITGGIANSKTRRRRFPGPAPPTLPRNTKRSSAALAVDEGLDARVSPYRRGAFRRVAPTWRSVGGAGLWIAGQLEDEPPIIRVSGWRSRPFP